MAGERFGYIPPTGSAAAARRDRQVVRLLTLLRILKEGGRPSVYELAARFHTRRVTIYRDLRALQAIGYPIMGDAEGRLSHPSLASGVRATIPPVLLSQEELAALVWATKQTGSKQPFRASLDSALLKLQSLAPGKEARLGLVLSGIFGEWCARDQGLRTRARVAPNAKTPHAARWSLGAQVPRRWHLRDHPLDSGLG